MICLLNRYEFEFHTVICLIKYSKREEKGTLKRQQTFRQRD